MDKEQNPQRCRDGFSLLDRAKAQALRRALDLEVMADGWLDGEGLRPQAKALRAFRKTVHQCPALFLNSGIFPKLAGGIQIEENLGGDEAEILITSEGVLEPSWNAEELPTASDLVLRRRSALSLPVPPLHALLLYDGSQIVVQGETGLGRLHGFALPDEEDFAFVGIIAGREIWRNFLRGRCCLREVHLDPKTRLFLFNGTGRLTPVEDVIKEAWLPDRGLMARDLPLKTPLQLILWSIGKTNEEGVTRQMQENPRFEDATRKLVIALRQPVEQDVAKVLHLPKDLALWVADMIDIGAPHRPHWLATQMRDTLEEFEFVRLMMPPKVALEIAGLMSSGLARHKAGAPEPGSFRLH